MIPVWMEFGARCRYGYGANGMIPVWVWSLQRDTGMDRELVASCRYGWSLSDDTGMVGACRIIPASMEFVA